MMTLYLIGPDGLVNLSFENFQKMVWMTIVLIHAVFATCIITIDTILQIFAYPCATRYADFIGFSGEPHLKSIGIINGLPD